MPVDDNTLQIDCVICQGEGSNDARRVIELMEACGVSYTMIYVDKTKSRVKRVLSVFRRLRDSQAEFIFMEGTGIGGGLAVIVLAFLRPSMKYLVSSGDAVDSFIRNQYGPVTAWAAGIYERLLYTKAFAFVGWSPYLVGRAYRMGARRGFTLEGASPSSFLPADPSAIAAKRAAMGILPSDVVVGVSGSLHWSDRQKYCYGLELLNAAPFVHREDIKFLIIGNGSGLERMKERAADDARFVWTDRVNHEDMPAYLGLMTAAVISQTSDEAGALRLTTKLPEYLACGVPVAMPAIPGAIDYLGPGDESAVWTLPTEHPASETYAKALASWINCLTVSDARSRRPAALAVAKERFSVEIISRRLLAFFQTFSEHVPSVDHKTGRGA